jgi:hypothetical protein
MCRVGCPDGEPGKRLQCHFVSATTTTEASQNPFCARKHIRQPPGHADARLSTSAKTVFSASVKSTTSKATSTVLERLSSQPLAWAPSALQGAEGH